MQQVNIVYSPVGHISGIASQDFELTRQVPWLYIIIGAKHKIVYVGETHDQNGLVTRLSNHFDLHRNSTLKQAASRRGGVRGLRPPFLVLGARLPFFDDTISFDATSKQVRLKIESAVHEFIAGDFINERTGWVLVSSSNPVGVRLTEDMEKVSRSIYECFLSSFSFFEQLAQVSPWNFVLLDYRVSESRDVPQDVGSLLEEIEVSLFQWLLKVLKAEYKEKWWTKGIPEQTRIQCTTRREQEGEGETLPPEAYLTLIDFKDIVRNNWRVCSRVVEEIAEAQGKDKATRWITELNEARKLWAHPIKQLFRQHDSAEVFSIRKLHSKVREVVENDMKVLEKGKQK